MWEFYKYYLQLCNIPTMLPTHLCVQHKKGKWTYLRLPTPQKQW